VKSSILYDLVGFRAWTKRSLNVTSWPLVAIDEKGSAIGYGSVQFPIFSEWLKTSYPGKQLKYGLSAPAIAQDTENRLREHLSMPSPEMDYLRRQQLCREAVQIAVNLSHFPDPYSLRTFNQLLRAGGSTVNSKRLNLMNPSDLSPRH